MRFISTRSRYILEWVRFRLRIDLLQVMPTVFSASQQRAVKPSAASAHHATYISRVTVLVPVLVLVVSGFEDFPFATVYRTPGLILARAISGAMSIILIRDTVWPSNYKLCLFRRMWSSFGDNPVPSLTIPYIRQSLIYARTSTPRIKNRTRCFVIR